MDDVLPSSVRHYRCDIIFVSNIADLASKICSPFGRLSILTTNVGIYLETTPAQTCHMFEVNTLAHYWLVQEFLPDMSKANLGAAIAFHEGLAAELVTCYYVSKIDSVLVTQGFTRTNLIRDLTLEHTWFNPLLHPEAIAEEVVKALPGWLECSLRCRLEKLMRADEGY
ncbi:Short-chain dehydrogenase/reductase SDR [Penicillium camemberti]|uniref:Short-chain dehydrogenase/reductase SDR n=1 Tax=Penicillium camemberti (strain FM 013) TaxID=1429867 RepID=A0A0G4PFY7_PENC3|nr:Short-chain dehydrogenase/reductase SDR [Penicillium camemberti]